MANFYKIVRTKMNLLMNKNGTPKGNKWSFDEENFSDKILSDLGETPVNGLAFCVGSIDLKPLKLTKRSDFMQSFNLNLISATEIIKAMADNLKKNKGSIVLFSTVAIKQGFPNHAIVASAKLPRNHIKNFYEECM